eukprot:jgi/Mesvir1/23749/Mv25773-RA.2
MCSENSVGIECFTTETPGFLAILKQRYSDFIVNEVDLSGTVLRLTDLSSIPKAPDEPTDTFLLPKDFEGRLAADSTRPASGEQPGGATAPDGTGSCGGGTTVDTDASGADVAAVAETFGQLLASQGELSAEQAGHEASRLKEFLLALQGSPLGLSTGGPVEPLLLPAIANKLHRTAVHQFFKKLPFLHTDTVMAPPSSLSGPRDPPGASGARAPASSGAGFSQIRVRSKRLHGEARAGAARGAGDAQGDADRGGKRSKGESEWRSNQWPSDRPPFLQFLLFKENKDTHDAIGLLSKLSNVPMGSLAFAGTKDKRAVTTQAVTAFKVTSERMAALNHKLHGMKVGNFKYVPAGLGLGDLKGNRFTIVLRRLEVESEDIVAAAVTALKETGFINYYGLQRFGNYAVPTHRIGAALARGEWAAAIDLILQGKASDSPDIARAHELYKKGQVADALRSVPKFMVIERSMLTQLQKNKSDLVGALLSIPRTMRMMYLHAYQSYLWNAAASERVKLFGAKAVVVGDLVRVSALNGATDGGCDDISEDVDELADAEAGKDLHLATGTGAGDSRKRPRDAPADTQAGSHRRTSVAAVKVVTQEDLTAGTFKVEDVVLPLPGKSVRYPNHEVAAVYKRLARQDNVDLEAWPHSVRDFSLPALQGDYRCIIQKPLDVTWSLARYSHPEEKLCPTDYDTLLEEQRKARGQSRGQQAPTGATAKTAVAEQGAAPTGDIAMDAAGGAEREEDGANASAGEGPSAGRPLSGAAGEADGGGAGSSQLASANSPPGVMTGLVIAFTLPTSCYATMALRELMKLSSQTSVHKAMNLL